MTQHDVTGVIAAHGRPLLEVATRDLVDPSRQNPAPGHWPSWLYAQVPEGLALCLICWRPIDPSQLGAEVCAGAARLLPPS